jgi:hypothetical protein
VLLELVSDLESLMVHHRSRGLSEEEAARRAEETLLVSPEALRELIGVHTTGYERWVASAAGRFRWGLDALLFLAGVLPMLLAAGFAVGAVGGPIGTSRFLWPLLACGLAILGLAVTKAWQLFVRRERSTMRLHRGLRYLPYLAAAVAVVGLLAMLIGVQGLTAGYAGGLQQAPPLQQALERVARDASLLALSLLLAIGAGIVWFVLVNRIAVIEREETEILLSLE